MRFSPEGRAVCVGAPRRAQRPDLVVHDSTQAHDADVDVIFLADQSGVFQRPPAGQCVATRKGKRKEEKKLRIKEIRVVLLEETPEHKSAQELDKQENRCRL